MAAKDGILTYDAILSDGVQDDGNDVENDLLESLVGLDKTAEIILFRQRTKSSNDGLIRVDSWSADICSASIILKAAEDNKKASNLMGDDVYYRVHIRKNNQLIPKGNKAFILGAKLQADMKLPTHAGQNDLLLAFMQQQAAEAREFRQTLRELLTAPKVDPRAEIMGQLEIMKAMKEAFGGNVAPVAAAPVDPLAMLNTVMGLVTGITDAKTKLLETLGAPEKDDTHPLVTLAKELGPQLLQTVQAEQRIRERNPPQRQTFANPVERDVTPRNDAPPPNNHGAPEYVVKFLQELQVCAENDADVEEILNDLETDANVMPLLKYIPTIDRPFRKVVDIVPEAIDYAFWWSDFIALAGERYASGNGDKDTPTGGAGGADANASPDAGGDTVRGG